jgi:hypothetical protein
MDKKPFNTKLIVGGVIVVVIIIGAIVLFMGGSRQAPQGAGATSTDSGMMTTVTGVAVVSPAPTVPPSTQKGLNAPLNPVPTPSTALAQITINLLTPIANNTWTIGQPNPIAWSNEADITGEIDLLDAQTKKFIGVIDSETGPHETSYSWDARSIYASRYSPIKKDVVPGVYAIRIKFDGNGLSSLVSGPVTIAN